MEDGRTASTVAEQAPGWYVSRVITMPAEKVRALGPLGGIVAPDGVALRIGQLVARPLPLEDHVSYEAVLSFPQGRRRRVPVELVVTRYSGTLAEVGIRPTGRVPRRRVGVEEYFDAVWSVLDALARSGSSSRATAAGGREPRSVARAS